jgi:hypothetical protein
MTTTLQAADTALAAAGLPTHTAIMAGAAADLAVICAPADPRTIELPRVSPEELGTLLAALRFYQARGMGKPENRSHWLHMIATDGDVVSPGLDDAGIDTLYDHING